MNTGTQRSSQAVHGLLFKVSDFIPNEIAQHSTAALICNTVHIMSTAQTADCVHCITSKLIVCIAKPGNNLQSPHDRMIKHHTDSMHTPQHYNTATLSLHLKPHPHTP